MVVSLLSSLILWLLFPLLSQLRIAKLEALLYNQGNLIWFCCSGVFLLMIDKSRCLIPSLHDLLAGPNSGSEASSSAMKHLQSKLDAVSAECLTEKEKVINHFARTCRRHTTVDI